MLGQNDKNTIITRQRPRNHYTRPATITPATITVMVGTIGDAKAMAGLGLGQLTKAFFFKSILKTFVDNTTILIGQAYG